MPDERDAMKTRIAALVILLATPCFASDIPIIIYSEAGQRPFSYEENGVPKGAYIENLQRVLKKVPGYNVQIRFASWARALEEARTGNSAGVLGVYYRPSERPFLIHSKGFYKEEVAVYCNREKIAGRTFEAYPDDFVGLRFGNQKGYLAPGPRFFEFAKAGKIAIVEGLEFSGLVKKMLAGEVDCVANPGLVLDEAIKTLESQGLPLHMRQKAKRIMTVQTETVHLGFSRKFEEQYPEIAKFRELFDAAAEF